MSDRQTLISANQLLLERLRDRLSLAPQEHSLVRFWQGRLQTLEARNAASPAAVADQLLRLNQRLDESIPLAAPPDPLGESAPLSWRHRRGAWPRPVRIPRLPGLPAACPAPNLKAFQALLELLEESLQGPLSQAQQRRLQDGLAGRRR